MSEKIGGSNKLMDRLIKVGNFLSSEKHFASISGGLMSTVGISLIGAIFMIISNPPVTADLIAKGGFWSIFTGWFNFAGKYSSITMLPYNMTVGLFAVIVCFSIAYQLAKKYEMSPMTNALTSMLMFLMVAAPVTTYKLEDGSSINALSNSYLGGQGLFTAIIVALVSIEINRLCKKYKMEIKLPDVIPPFLADSFSAIIPLGINIIFFGGLSLIVQNISGALLPKAIMDLLAAPLSAANSLPGALILVLVSTALWSIGVHGTAIIAPLYLPITIGCMTSNADLVAAGQNPIFYPIFLTAAASLLGGTGNTLGFVLLCLKSKSEQLRAIGKVGIVPGLFGVNEPVTFGAPVMLNPILMIPYVGGSLILVIVMYACFKLGILSPYYVLMLASLPIGFGQFLPSMSIKNAIFQFLMVPFIALIWYPFFKIYEKQLVARETAAREVAVEN